MEWQRFFRDHGFVDWRNASSFASRLIAEVIFDLKDFTSDDDEAKAAFDVSLYVYHLFADTDIDDSGGETQYKLKQNTASDLWHQVRKNILAALSAHRVDIKHLLAAEGLKE